MFNGSIYYDVEIRPIKYFHANQWIFTHTMNSLGLIGNMFIVITLLFARSMSSSRYNSYRCLHLSDLLFNVIYWIDMAILHFYGRLDRNVYNEYTFASHTFALTRALWKFMYSCVTYVCIYMALIAGVDRCLALWFPHKYNRTRAQTKKLIDNTLIFVSILLATFVNSWGAFYRWEVIELADIDSRNNLTITRYTTKKYKPIGFERDAFESMNFYNSAIRILYCVLILALTVIAVLGFKRIERRKRLLLIDVRFDRSLLARRSSAVLRRERAERSLYWLMIIIVTLGICQVLPGEVARLFAAYYHSYEASICRKNNDEHCLRTIIFVYWLSTSANVLAVVIRNIKFYLYIPMNAQVRQEAYNVCVRCCRGSDTSDDHTSSTLSEDSHPLITRKAHSNSPIKVEPKEEPNASHYATIPSKQEKSQNTGSASAIIQPGQLMKSIHASSESVVSNQSMRKKINNFQKTKTAIKLPILVSPADSLRIRMGSTASERLQTKVFLAAIQQTPKRQSIDVPFARTNADDVLL